MSADAPRATHDGRPRGGVRPLQDSDLPQLAGLHDRCFKRTIYKDLDSLQRQLRKVFQENPWRDLGIDSLVWDDGTGRVLGFAGLIARPMRFRGKPLVSALSCQVMVAPDARGQGIAEALLRASTDGPQTLTYSDILNPAATAVWRRIGGTEIPELSLQWVRTLRPFQWFAGQTANISGRAWAVKLARPVLYALDALIRSAPGSPYSYPAGEGWSLRSMSQRSHLEFYRHLDESYELVPDYDEQSLSWLLGLINGSVRDPVRLEAMELINPRGDTAGIYLMSLSPGGTATVLQMGAESGQADHTLQSMLNLADSANCRAVRGRLQPEHLATVSRWPGFLKQGDPRVMAISRDPEILHCMREGRAWMTHLEGEWCIGF